MAMHSYPVTGVGINVSELDWKMQDRVDFIEEQMGGDYYDETIRGIPAIISLACAGDDEERFLIVYDHKPYQPTPFNSFGELQDFFVRALKDDVRNTEAEIRSFIEDIDKTHWG